MLHPSKRTRVRTARLAVAILATVVGTLTGSAALAETLPVTPKGPFSVPESLRGNVDFWKDVFSKHGLDRVVVHHIDAPEVVFDVVPLPGELRPDGSVRYTDEQRDFVDAVREAWEHGLRDLGAKLDAGETLDDAEVDLVERIRRATGQGPAEAAGRVRTQRGLRERFRRGLEIAARFDTVYREIFREKGLPEDLALLPHVESSFQVSAHSSAGAVGIWQFTRSTGRQFMRVDGSLDERRDPILAARAAAGYFAAAYERLGEWPLAVTSYNHGVAGMARAKERHGADLGRIVEHYRSRTFGFASKNFYASFVAAREVALSADAHFPEGIAPEPAFDEEPWRLEKPASAAWLARRFGLEPDTLFDANPAWSSRVRSGRWPVPAGATVWLPAGVLAREPAVDEAWETFDVYVVRRGDTLSGIAARFGVSLGNLKERNGLGPRESLIRPGQELTIPAP